MRKKNEKKEEIPLTEKKKNKGGRPSIYTKELAEKICRVVATHPWGLKRICDENSDFPTPETIRLWKITNAEFFALYARAKVDQADCFVEDCVDISDLKNQDKMIDENGKEVADHEFLARTRLRVDTRKWIASKLLPKLYGDKVVVEQKEEENAALKEEIKALRAKLDEQNKRDY